MISDMPAGGTESGAVTGRQETAALGQGTSGASMREELANLKSDLDALMSHASTLTEGELREARDRMLARFSSVRYAARGMAAQASRQFNQGMDVTVDYVRDKPLQSVALAAGLGLVVGAMLRRS